MFVRTASFAFLSALGSLGVSAIFGPIGTDRPAPAGGNVANTAPPNSFFAGHAAPFPTDDWWVGYAAGSTGDDGSIAAGPYPYQSATGASGIQFGISNSRQFDGTSIKQPTQMDWLAGFVEHSGNGADHRALSWVGSLIRAGFGTGTEREDLFRIHKRLLFSTSPITSYMVPGSPYITLNYASATPKFTSKQGLVTSFNGQSVPNGGAAVSATGTNFTVINTAGAYLIYSLNGAVTLSASASNGGGTILGSSKFSGVLRMVRLNDPSHQALLSSHVSTYPTAVTTDYSFSGNTGTLSFTWTTTGTASNLLMLTFPHHRIKMQNPNFPATTALNYLTTKGHMYPALGNVWNLQYALSTITWNAPRAPDSSCTASIVQGLVYEIGKLNSTAPPVPGDFYYWGGALSATARLALIAEAMGRTDLIPTVTKYLETSFNYWFQSSSTTLPAYETNWGGIVSKAGATNVNVDFGNGFYNDHHFHYGYFLHVAAIIAKYDSSWMNTHKTYINYFLRDIINPSKSDPYFAVTRHRDWFAGHSWASGIANGAGSRDQESTGEAINAYYGALLWATVTGNTDMVNYAKLLLASEQHGAQVYWHMVPSSDSNGRDQPYPEQAVRNLVSMGNVEDWQSGAWLFWGAQKVEISSIQILPVTPVNEYLYDDAWAQAVYSYTASEIADPSIADDWKCLIYLAYSAHNPQVAAADSASLLGWGSGNTYTNQLYFISTRPNSGGAICSASQANPTGHFVLKSTTTGKFVTSSASNTNLVANGAAQSNAAVFNFGFAPNAGTIQSVSTAQYVTADQSGTFPLAADRGTPSTWEIFQLRPKAGAGSGVYTIMCGSNHLYVNLGGDGSLVNSAANASAAAGFQLIAVS